MLFLRRQSDGRGRRAGQSIVEISLAFPLLAMLLLGGFNTTILITDKVTAGYAVRQGARLASELGGCPGTSCPATSGNQATIDQYIVRNVLASTSSMTNMTLTEIDIYLASSSDGKLQAGDLQDQFNGSGTALATQTFTLGSRNQTPPNETAVGVRLLWTYKPPALNWASLSMSDYAVMKAAPVLT